MDMKKYNNTIESIKATNINGCITGSCLIDCDKSTWDQIPDIDIFVYSLASIADAVRYFLDQGYVFGIGEKPELAAQEEWKYKQTIVKGSTKFGLATIKLHKDDININITWHKHKRQALHIISDFDISLIIRAYDITTNHYMDYSKVYKEEYLRCFTDYDEDTIQKYLNDDTVITPNPHKIQDTFDMYNAGAWLRQWDRVIKYWNRGFNTMLIAKFYTHMIGEVLSKGNIFINSDQAKLAWEEGTKEIKKVHEQISTWIKIKEKELEE